MTSLRPLGRPGAVAVETGADGAPRTLTPPGGRRHAVEGVRDDWLVQDLWWTGRPVDRHYFEVVLDTGRLVTVYREAADAAWFAH